MGKLKKLTSALMFYLPNLSQTEKERGVLLTNRVHLYKATE
jgi:hypothetical protein